MSHKVKESNEASTKKLPTLAEFTQAGSVSLLMISNNLLIWKTKDMEGIK